VVVVVVVGSPAGTQSLALYCHSATLSLEKHWRTVSLSHISLSTGAKMAYDLSHHWHYCSLAYLSHSAAQPLALSHSATLTQLLASPSTGISLTRPLLLLGPLLSLNHWQWHAHWHISATGVVAVTGTSSLTQPQLWLLLGHHSHSAIFSRGSTI
jgi:hypothetical protein